MPSRAARRPAPPDHGRGSVQPARRTARPRAEPQGRTELQDGAAGGGQGAAVRRARRPRGGGKAAGGVRRTLWGQGAAPPGPARRPGWKLEWR